MSPQAGWILREEVVPRLRAAIPNAVHYVGCEDAQELIQDATAMAGKLLDSVERAGKKVTPGNIAYYTIQHIKSGRRSTRSSTVDAHGSGTQLAGRARLNSFEEVVAADHETGGEIFLLHDVFSNDQEDPAIKAARKMDWETFCVGLSKREKVTVLALAEGRSLKEVATEFGISNSTMQGTKRSLAGKLLEFMGVEILIEIGRSPRWKDGLEAIREKLACRHERQAV